VHSGVDIGKNAKLNGGWSVAQVVETLPSKQEALSSNPRSIKNKRTKSPKNDNERQCFSTIEE
jgi:hypothetical protein